MRGDVVHWDPHVRGRAWGGPTSCDSARYGLLDGNPREVTCEACKPLAYAHALRWERRAEGVLLGLVVATLIVLAFGTRAGVW